MYDNLNTKEKDQHYFKKKKLWMEDLKTKKH